MHERSRKSYNLVPSEDRTEVHKKLAYVLPPESSLSIGEYGVWSIKLSKSDGDFDCFEYGDVNRKDDLKNVLQPIIEGQEVSFELTKYERSPEARSKCIFHYGALCQSCNIDFGEIYGDIGKGFIHVHHIVPISQMTGEYEVNPITDLIPLCPNCHAMTHRRDPPYTVAELKEIITIQTAKNSNRVAEGL